ncbi:hypothetical protein B296_00013575 [Ensete ventricosum]|uniref:Uncharacterized protein n=1 Tax=Ensete ventricosum TaxID=4639 RepID=A0A427B0L3_ENSVE|nr:hypothetical protein B296_00013575 [Ensete ventricosum]
MEEYRSIRAATFDQMNTTSMVVMEMWHSSVRKWYSATSNRNQITVAPARTPADKYLFLHSKMSATITPRRHNIKHPLCFRDQGLVNGSKRRSPVRGDHSSVRTRTDPEDPNRN